MYRLILFLHTILAREPGCGLSPMTEGTVLFSDGYVNEEANLGRIINGQVAQARMLPWQVRLNGRYLCGGTLVTMKVYFVLHLTAGITSGLEVFGSYEKRI